MNKRFRVISLKSEALQIEYEDMLERDRKYEEAFRREFFEEIRYLMERDAKNARRNAQRLIESPKEIENQISEGNADSKPHILKTIYRALARITHPDRAGPDAEEEFKEIQTSYNTDDLIGLMAAATRNNVEPELSEEEMEALNRMLRKQEAKINEIRESVRWKWGISDKEPAFRKVITASIGVDEDGLKAWRQARTDKERQDRNTAARKARQERKSKKNTTTRPRRNPARVQDLKKAAFVRNQRSQRDQKK